MLLQFHFSGKFQNCPEHSVYTFFKTFPVNLAVLHSFYNLHRLCIFHTAWCDPAVSCIHCLYNVAGIRRGPVCHHETIKSKFFFKNSKEQLDIYLTPIIAECRSHEFGFYKECVYTINGTLEIWKDFWDKTDNRILQLILNHDFSKFRYRVSISQKDDLNGNISSLHRKE